jgi:hypothetical protein
MYPPTETALRQVGAGPGEDFRRRVLAAYDKPVWNTEGGHWDSGFFHGSNAPSALWGPYLFPFEAGYRYTESSPLAVENVAINFIETIGNGQSKYFYYDFRTAPSPSLFRNHPSALEYDDSVRPKAVALSALAKLFDHSRGLGQLNAVDDHTRAYLFNRRGTPLIALYSSDNASRSVALSGLKPDQITKYDIMGNRLAVNGTTIRFGRQPVYLEGQGITVPALRAAFEHGTVWNRADTGTPNLTINSGPRGTGSVGDAVSFTWVAADDTYTPGLSDENAIVYSYRVEGSASLDGWSGWSANTSTDLVGLPRGQYVFQVRARDEAGNESPIVNRSFAIGQSRVGGPAAPVPPGESRVGVVPVTAAPLDLTAMPGPPAPTSRALTVAGGALKMGFDGAVHLQLSCPASATGDCSGTASLVMQRKLMLGKSPFRMASGETAILSIRLSKRKQRLVRKHKRVRGLVIVEARDGAGNALTANKRVTLRATKQKNMRDARSSP